MDQRETSEEVCRLDHVGVPIRCPLAMTLLSSTVALLLLPMKCILSGPSRELVAFVDMVLEGFIGGIF